MTLDKSAMFYDLYKNLKVDIYLNAHYTFLSTVLSAIVYILSFFFSLLLFLFFKVSGYSFGLGEAFLY